MEGGQLKHRGFSLLEVLLAAALGFIALGLMTYALVPMLHYAAWGSARSELVQAATLTSHYLVEDLQRAPLEGISLPATSEPGLLAVHAVVSVTDTGVSVWDQQLIVYNWDSSQRSLTRKLYPPAPPAGPAVTSGAPLRLGPGQLRSLVSQANGTERSLAQGILKEFSLTTGSTSSLPLHLHMLFELDVPGHAPESFQHEQDLYLRNGQL